MNSKLPCLAVLCVSLAGCVQPTGPVHSSSAATSERAPRSSAVREEADHRLFHLSTSVEAGRSMVTGSFNVVQLSVTNHEREPVTLGFGSGCQLLYVVYDLHGNQVSSSFGCTAFPTQLTIGARETVRQTTTWEPERYDYGQHAYVPLPAGLYRMHAYISEHGYESPPFMVRLVEH